MSITPIITFKAGTCDIDYSITPPKVQARETPGYLYLYEEDELVHFCWRPRSASMTSPELELVMVPTDGHFIPYKNPDLVSSSPVKSPTNGRIFVLKFQSSTQRHFFWLQSKSQHPQGDPAWFSPRDVKLGDIVDRLLQGDRVNAREEFANVQNEQGDNDGGDAEMGDAEHDTTGDQPRGSHARSTEARETEPRQGDLDRGPAPTDDAAAAAVQNFLRSMQGNSALTSSIQHPTTPQGQIYTTLSDLLPASFTVPFIDSANPVLVDTLLSNLPSELLLLGQEAVSTATSTNPDPESTGAALSALSLVQKKAILKEVLRSPQFTQSLGSLTSAIRDGGLPGISDALHIPVANGGFIAHGSVPLGGGDAMEAFVNGVIEMVQKKDDKDREMETE